jgi:two-component system, OmpR family, sensor kinase
MSKKLIIRLVFAALPLGMGLGGYFVFHLAFPMIPLLVFKADVGSAVAVLGGLVSLLLLAWVIGWGGEFYRGMIALGEERRQQEISRRRFIRRLDHELKNPLTGLRAALVNLKSLLSNEWVDQTSVMVEDFPKKIETSLQQGAVWPEASRTLTDAEYQIERLSRLVAGLRKLAELEEIPLETSQVNLADLLEDTAGAVCSLPAYADRKIQMVIPRVPWPLPEILGDRDLLELAFYNLVENALKYSSQDDTVEVRAVEDGRKVQIEIADNGSGIPSEDLPRVFDELYRGSNARGLEGSGLGLALVRRVIERHGGEINVRSRQGEQQGTIFRVVLPIR